MRILQGIRNWHINRRRQQASREGFIAEAKGIAELQSAAPKGTIVAPAKRNRKAVDLWVIRIVKGKRQIQPFQFKNVSSMKPIVAHLKKNPNVPVVVNSNCKERLDSRAKKCTKRSPK